MVAVRVDELRLALVRREQREKTEARHWCGYHIRFGRTELELNLTIGRNATKKHRKYKTIKQSYILSLDTLDVDTWMVLDMNDKIDLADDK